MRIRRSVASGHFWFDAAFHALETEDQIKTDADATTAWNTELPLYFADFDAHADAYRAAGGVRAYAAPALGAVPENGKPTDFRPELGKIRARTLVVVGAHDVCCGKRWGNELVARIKGAQLVELEHSGHMAHLEEPERFAQVVAGFVTK
jgi:pimeloyl-ACP methyl ester carboxylesterase